MEISEGNGPLALWPRDTDDRFKRGQCHAHVGRVDGDALLARAENGVNSVEAVDRRAAGARLALITGRRRVVEVVAASPLHGVSTVGGHVAELCRCAGEDRAGQHRVPVLDLFVVRGVRVRHERAEPESAVWQLLNAAQRYTCDVDEPAGPGHVLLHQVDEVRATGNEYRRLVSRDFFYRRGHIGDSCVCERVHRLTLPSPSKVRIACWMAATMFE